MSARDKGPVALVNERLKAAGRAERVYRGGGMLYLGGGEAPTWRASGLEGTGAAYPTFPMLLSEVVQVFGRAGIEIDLSTTTTRKARTMKLRKLAPQITKLARAHIGGPRMYVWIGQRCSTIKGNNLRSINLEDFPNHDDTDLFDTLDGWRKMDCPENAEFDFYVYADDELRDNLGILVRDGAIVAYRIVGDKIGNSHDAWRPIGGGEWKPKSAFSKVTA